MSNKSIDIEGVDDLTSPNNQKEEKISKASDQEKKKGPIPFLLNPPAVEKKTVETQTMIDHVS